MEIVLTVLAIVACVLLFSFAIFIHEFGHFLAARLLGLRVDRFSIGFGPALWKRTIKGVEYRISAIPFGGYVALPQLDPEGTDALQGGTENKEPLQEIAAWKRIVVAFAGPFGNIVLAVALAFLLAALPGARFGETPASVRMVAPGGVAEACGLREGDRILSIDGHAVDSWNDANTGAALSGGREVPMTVRRAGKELTIAFRAARNEVIDSYMIDALPSTAPVIGGLLAGRPAEKAGVQIGDRVLSVNGEEVVSFAEVRAAVKRRGGDELVFAMLRDGTNVVVRFRAEYDAREKRHLAGFLESPDDGVAAWMPARSPIEQLKWDAGQILRVLKGLVTPKETKAVAGALGGPVMIAQVLYKQVRRDIWDAVGFLRFVDVNLAILNLLPIPVLDGGLILFALLELLFRRKPSRRIVNGLSMAFMWFFLALMLLLVWRDISRSRRISRATDEFDRRHEQYERRLQDLRNFKPAFDLGR